MDNGHEVLDLQTPRQARQPLPIGFRDITGRVLAQAGIPTNRTEFADTLRLIWVKPDVTSAERIDLTGRFYQGRHLLASSSLPDNKCLIVQC